jgi:phosphoenolpyruvate carboxykinase (ATP)
MYHFISGYTAKVAGTEVGVTEPSDVLGLLRRPVPGLAPDQVRRAAGRAHEAAQARRADLAGQHRLVGGAYGVGKRG